MKNNNKIVLIQPATAFSVKTSPFYEMFDSVGLLSLQQYLINNNYEVKYFHIPN